MKNPVSLLWELPLAVLSFLFYKVMKLAIGNLYTAYLILNQQQASQWRVLSAETLKSPLSLPVLMTKGPRWNTHAIIGTLGPFKVQEKLAIAANIANAAAASWIAVIYRFPSYKTIATIESYQIELSKDWAELNLAPGRYSIGLRYYDWQDCVELPTVKIDGELLAESCQISPKVNGFYDNLIEQKNWFYTSLHYYIFTILKWREYLPEAFVNAEYLPVGSPDTRFFYGCLEKGQSLQFAIAPQIANNCNFYLTTYDRASLPLDSATIEGTEYQTLPLPNNGYYLIRARHQPGREADFDLAQLQAHQEGDRVSIFSTDSSD